MNRVDIRNRSREITELTVSDVSNTVIDLYARDGYERVMNLERRWPFLETSTTFTTVQGQAEYSVENDIADLRDIKSIRAQADGARLMLVGYEDAEDVWAGSTTGTPQHWSWWADEIRLWPTPSAALTYDVRGYRKYTSWWESDGTEIDADGRLHTPILYFVISRLYQLQEDPEMAAMYANSFAEAVQLARAEIMRSPAQRPMILHRGTRLPSHSLLTIDP